MNLAPDFETKILLDIHDRLIPWPDEWRKLETYIRERTEMVRLGVMRCPSWFQEELNTLDSRLRAWWNSWTEQWVIDRLQDEGVVERMTRAARDEGNPEIAQAMEESASGILTNGRYYLTILHFQPTPTLQLDRQLLDMLRKSDMQRFESPSAYLAEKRKEAERVQAQNENKATEKVLEAVDSLSSKQRQNFMDVEMARATGETITAAGDDAKWLERAKQDRLNALKEAEERGERITLDTNPDRAINPGMHPQRYVRSRRDK